MDLIIYVINITIIATILAFIREMIFEILKENKKYWEENEKK